MNRSVNVAIFVILFILICATIVFAQDEDITEYMSPFHVLPQIIATIGFAFLYLLIYAGSLLITLSYLKVYNGWDNDFLIWIGLLWLGGMIINAVTYKYTGYHHIFSLLLSLPLLFGWSVLINTRNFSDLTMKNALRVALVIVVICTPWFSPIWQVKPPPKIQLDNSLNLHQVPNEMSKVPCRVFTQHGADFFA